MGYWLKTPQPSNRMTEFILVAWWLDLQASHIRWYSMDVSVVLVVQTVKDWHPSDMVAGALEPQGTEAHASPEGPLK